MRWTAIATGAPRSTFVGLLASGCIALLLAAASSRPATAADLSKIETIVVIYAENRSFDHLFGLFPGANGIANATEAQKTQRDHDGTVLPYLAAGVGGLPQLPNGPFRIDAPPVNRSLDQVITSPIHAYYHNREQINGGRNDMFAAMSNAGAWVMGYVDGSSLRLWQWAKEFTLADNFFMGAFGGSFLNHQWLICACTPTFPDPPTKFRVELGPDGRLLKEADSPSARDGPPKLKVDRNGGQVSPDGFAVNTTQPPYQPSGIPPAEEGDLNLADAKGNDQYGRPLPVQTSKTVGDTLSAKNIDWAWYAGGWNEALKDGRRAPGAKRTVIYSGRTPGSLNFQPHHQPFNYFARFAPGSADRERHLRDGDDLMRDIDAGKLPAVAFYKPVGIVNQHPSSTDIATGDAHIADILERLRKSPQWKSMLVIVTYDENGGFWDHVPPPSGPGWSDRWGPATRIPTILVSPFAKKGAIDSTAYDTTSILKLITLRFGLEPLPGVRPNVGDLTAALE